MDNCSKCEVVSVLTDEVKKIEIFYKRVNERITETVSNREHFLTYDGYLNTLKAYTNIKLDLLMQFPGLVNGTNKN